MLVSKSLRGANKAFDDWSSPSSNSCIAHMKRMRYRMERLVFLPFSLSGCGSTSSVGKTQHPKEAESQATSETNVVTRRKVREQSTSGVKSKRYTASWALPRPGIASRMQRFIRGIKSFSQIFAYKEEEEEEVEKEMEIGFPTDVKHVTHVGLDGLTTNNIVKVMEDLRDPSETHSISVDEYEKAMVVQAQAPIAI